MLGCLQNKTGRQEGHAPLLGHDAREVLSKADGAAEDPDIGRQRSQQCRCPPDLRPAHRIARRYQE